MARSLPPSVALFKALLHDRRMLVVFALGFSSGLPFLLSASTLQAWCTESRLNLAQIGLFGLVGLPYTCKFLWSPAFDWLKPPQMFRRLGLRRGWLLVTQLGIIAALCSIAFSSPQSRLTLFLLSAVALTFFSASQDIVIDAYQIEILPAESYGLGNQIYILGYRVGMILSGGGALMIAAGAGWRVAYLAMAGVMSLGLVTTFLAAEPPHVHNPNKTPRAWETFLLPLQDFFSTGGNLRGYAPWVLAFFFLYKIGGDLTTALSTPFYLQMGFTKMQIGAIVKVFGLIATLAGGIIGGITVVSLGLRRSLWIFGFVQAAAGLSFAWLAIFAQAHGPIAFALASAVSIENLAAGLGTAAYATYMGRLVNRKFTATQYALLSSFMGMTRVFSTAPAGWLAERMGWSTYFVFCAVAAAPGLVILFRLDRSPIAPDAFRRPHAEPSPTAPPASGDQWAS